MKSLFSWSIVICIALFFLTTLVLSFIAAHIVEPIMFLLLLVALLSAIGLTVSLIIERIKDRKDDDNAIGKY